MTAPARFAAFKSLQDAIAGVFNAELNTTIEVTLRGPKHLTISGPDAAVIAARQLATAAKLTLTDSATDADLPGERFDYYTHA